MSAERESFEIPAEVFETGEAGEYGFESGTGSAGSSWEAGEFQEAGEQGAVLPESDELALAAEFMGIQSEEEMDRFLGGLLKKVAGGVADFARSPQGKMLGGVLKQAAKRVIPAAGRAIGGYVGGSTGAQVGGHLASAAGKLLGLEVEGLSGEDQEFAVARRFVRFASTAGRAVAARGRQAPPHVVRSTIVRTARRYAPGLIPIVAGSQDNVPIEADDSQPSFGAGLPRAGRWYRRGRRIVIVV